MSGEPFLSWDAHQDCYYTLVAFNPDALTMKNHDYREFRNWLVFNIPGDRVGAGDVAEEYVAGSKHLNYPPIVYQQIYNIDDSVHLIHSFTTFFFFHMNES